MIIMANTYFYMRISTKESSDKQSFQRQYKALENYAKNNDLKFNERSIYKDDVSGSTFDREDWQVLENILQSGDTIVFKEVSRFTRQCEEGYKKYMELMGKGINLIFLDNPTISTNYIENLMQVAKGQQRIAQKALENTIELLLMVELDRVEQERIIIVNRIKQGIEASKKTQGRKVGQLDKMSDELKADIKMFLTDRNIKQIDLMNKHNISRNTLKKYIKLVSEDV